MANEWNVAYPIDHTEIGDGPLEIRKLKTSAKKQIDREHETPVDGDETGGEHSNGSAVVYVGSDTPTNRPDGSTALADNDIDDGRLWIDDTASPGTLKRWKDDGFEDVIATVPPNFLSAYTHQDSEGITMVKDHAYKAATDGQVTVFDNVTEDKSLNAYVGLTSDPVGAGDLIGQASHGEAANISFTITFLVAKDEYFEITYSGSGEPTIRWKSFGTLSKPVDNN